MTPKALTLQSSLPLASLPTARIPQLGFGVYRSPRDNCISSCSTALSAGYRHIDTAQFYHNEAEVGAAVRQAPLPRHELFLTTKIMRPSSSTKPGDMTFDRIRRSVDVMDVGGYVDLFLIHTPSSGRKGRRDLWEALGRAQREGLIRAAGVSNFGVGQIEELKGVEGCSWPPAVNQIELHPWCQQRTLVSYCQQHHIVIEAYSPIVRNQKAKDPTLVAISKVHGKSTAQILIRYALQKGWVPLPKSDTPSRIRENADVYDFELAEEQMAKLDRLDEGPRGAIVMAADND